MSQGFEVCIQVENRHIAANRRGGDQAVEVRCHVINFWLVHTREAVKECLVYLFSAVLRLFTAGLGNYGTRSASNGLLVADACADLTNSCVIPPAASLPRETHDCSYNR